VVCHADKQRDVFKSGYNLSMFRIPLVPLILLVALAGCVQQPTTIRQTSGVIVDQTALSRESTSSTAVAVGAAATNEPTATAEPTATPEPPTPTPDPFAAYAPLTIEGMRAAQQAGEFGSSGAIEIVQTLEETANFTRYLIAYPSGDLRITGMLNRPRGDGPFPVVILVHGYYPLDVYQTGNGTKLAADYLANRGFMTISPDLRSHAGSDDAPNLFRNGHVIDVLHLIPLAQKLPSANGGKVGLWGHSNGGAIAAKAMVISEEIGAALIYAPASLTIAEDYQFRVERSAARAGRPPGRRDGVINTLEIEFPVKPDQGSDLYQRLSPLPYVQYADMPVEIHWGTADEVVPRKWPGDLYDALVAASKNVEFFEYPGQPHSFQGASNALYLERMVEFFRQQIGQ
jgi:uncharacterized protein